MHLFRLFSWLLMLVAVGLGVYRGVAGYPFVQNPDPNHTHADFAIWVNGEQLDFSGPEFMSGLSTDETTHDEESEVHDKYLHLHDGNGHVVHRHKQGLAVGEFFASIGFTKGEDGCYIVPGGQEPVCNQHGKTWRMFVNGEEKAFDLSYIFADMDHLLFTYGATNVQIQEQLSELTDDACKYSKTCPWKGSPPTENCVADPEVPCTL